LAEYQRRYRDEPYRGPDTPRPEWGPYDHELLGRLAAYVETMRAEK
jgi:choline-sulfatase